MPTLAKSPSAYHDYEILEKLEAGLVLSGAEVRSVKLGQMNLRGSYIVISRTGQAQLIGCHIAAYRPASSHQSNYQPDRSRTLLLKKSEIIRLGTQVQNSGLTILPLSVYTKGNLIKLEIGLGRGKKKHDKRESIKKREIQKEINRRLRAKG